MRLAVIGDCDVFRVGRAANVMLWATLATVNVRFTGAAAR